MRGFHASLAALIMGLIALSAQASEQGEVLRRDLIALVARDPGCPVMFAFGSGPLRPASLRQADESGFQIAADGASIVLRWSDMTDAGMYAMFTPSVVRASTPAVLAYLHLGIALGRKDDPIFRKMLEEVRHRDSAAAQAIEALMAERQPAAVTGIAPGAPPAPADAKPALSAVSTTGADASMKPTKASRARYGMLSHPEDVAAMDARLGPRAPSTVGTPKPPGSGKAKTDSDPVPLAPIIPSTIGAKTPYNFGTPVADPGGYWTTQGQVLYVPDGPGDAGVDRIHVGCYGNHALQFTPIPAWWGGTHPEPGVQQREWSELTGGKMGRPFFIERAYSSYSENGFMIFTSGLIGAGSVNNVPKYPCFRFPADKWPTALALTNRNELLLVSVWDAKDQKAQLAVLALGLSEGGRTGFCLPNWGIHNLVKLLGYVDLPGLELPTGIACTAASDPWAAAPAEAWNYDYANPDKRKKYLEDPAIARSGYAVVISKPGNKAAFVDLQPLLTGIRMNCFTTPELAAKARDFGNGEDQWPYTFKQAPAMKPTLVTTINVPAPTAVRTSMRAAHGRPAIAAIACEKGEVQVFRVGALLTEQPASAEDVQLHAVIPVGANPCSMAYQRIGDPLRKSTQGDGVGSWDAINYTFLVCCRGSQEIDFIEVNPTGGECYRRFRDQRLVDPVHVQQMRVNSGDHAYVFTVCDFKGRKVINYRVGPAYIDGKAIPVTNGAPIDCTGWMDLPGYPFMVSADNVP